ncbi:MAG TPA: hypothetical protein DGG95_00200, partial [Cytophagales bacterium]|nr:hypothetical protein [Cytophagales bacterium]
MKIVFFIFHLMLFGFISYWLAKKNNCFRNKLFWSALAYHFVAGISVGLIYTFYYEANDTFYYFNTAVQLANYSKENFIYALTHLFDYDEI